MTGTVAERVGARLDSASAPMDMVGSVPSSGGRGNTAGYANRKLNTLLDAAAIEPDTDTRAKLYASAELTANRELP